MTAAGKREQGTRARHSLKRQLMLVFAGVAIPAVLTALFLLYSSSEEGYSRIVRAMQENLELFVLTLNDQMESTENTMLNLSLNSAAFRQLSDQSTPVQAYLNLYQVQQELPAILVTNEALAGIILCSPTNDLYVGEYGTLYGAGNQQLAQKLALESYFTQINLLRTLNTETWYVETIGERTYLLRSVAYHNVYITAAIDLQFVFEENIQNYGMDGEILVYDSAGNLLVGDSAFDCHDSIEWEAEDTGQVKQSGTTMIAARTWLHGLEIISLLPYTTFGLLGGNLAVFTVLAALFVLLSIPFLLYYMHRVVFQPMNSLVDTMRQISEGDLKARPSEKYQNAEFVQVNETFNRMIDQITALKIDSYERQLEVERSEMAALKFQIRPHFVLNCLKNVYALAETGSIDDLQELVVLLGQYLRYILAYQQDTISLRQEVEQCCNYVRLSSIGQSVPIAAVTDIDPQLSELRLPSVSLLTLTENCIKHGRVAEHPLEIRITGRLLHAENGPIADIAVADNGKGFGEEDLRMLNGGLQPGEKGEHVGLYNVMRRLQLQYGADMAMAATNERNGGARIEFFLPLGAQNQEKERQE